MTNSYPTTMLIVVASRQPPAVIPARVVIHRFARNDNSLYRTTAIRRAQDDIEARDDKSYGAFAVTPAGVPSDHFWTFTTTSALGVPEPLTAIGSASSLLSPNIDGVAPGT